MVAQKKLIDKTKIAENVLSLVVLKVVLAQFKLKEHQYHRSLKYHILLDYKSYAYLLIVEPSNLVFLKT